MTCVECEQLGCPTEGMTRLCPVLGCGAEVCLGHGTRHAKDKHSMACLECQPYPGDPCVCQRIHA